MQRKKVGLATCFIDNYGACLQAYALQTKIEESGCDCKIIKYTQPAGYGRRTWRYNSLLLSLASFLKKDLRIHHGNKPKFEKFRKKYLKFTKKYESSDSLYNFDLGLDAYVCGSDQIWNPLLFKGNDPIYMLDFVPNGKKRIAYAPSIGLSEFPKQYIEDFKNKINQFDYISVRESAGKDIAQPLTDKEVKVVLDPTLLLNGNEWSKLASEVKIDRPYIFCYIFGDRHYIGEFVEYVKKETGLNVVCIPYTKREKESDYIKVYDAGPCEFLWLIKNAKFVITDSFHATAFSINFNTPFYSLLRNEDSDKINMNSRIFSILKLVGLEERMVAEDVKYPFDIKTDIDFSNANKCLDEKRRCDFGDLKKQLENI